MKKYLLILAVAFMGFNTFAADYYTADMISILQSNDVKDFVAENNLTIVSISYSNGGLCPTGKPCPKFFSVHAPNEQGQACVFFVAVTNGNVQLHTNPMNGSVEMNCQ